MKSNYDKFPKVKIEGFQNQCWSGWQEIGNVITTKIQHRNQSKTIVLVDCYHGVLNDDIIIPHDNFFDTKDFFKSEKEITEMISPYLTTDRVFGKMNDLTIADYFDTAKKKEFQKLCNAINNGVVIVYGIGASELAQQGDILIYADMARWEIQLRMRKKEIDNIGVSNKHIDFALQYKQGFFIDWRVCDAHKIHIKNNVQYWLDTNDRTTPKMVSNDAMKHALNKTSKQPFRVVPFFDPGPWGGQWMKEVCDLDKKAENYAWCFDCVPEENSLLFDFGEVVIEIPSINLVFEHPVKLLGEKVYAEFGCEFPIRFDFLDTIDGGNLSLQVHPTKEYIINTFGMAYTQDESYYILDAKDDAKVYLGLKENIDSKQMIADLQTAQEQSTNFDAEKYVQTWNVKKHDHILIPAGTVHCSGKNAMVLEISATPYIFTFKLWDWNRMGLDGKPRPIHIEHGEKVINWSRVTNWTKKNLVNQFQLIEIGDGWEEENTGLHQTQFIETRRRWFTKKTTHNTNGTVNVLNLIEGEEILVESPKDLFEPFVVHYAETFIIPACVEKYTIRPYGKSIGKKCGTIRAYVRDTM